MKRFLQAFRDLHRAPDDWKLPDYASYAWRLTRAVWLVMILLCILLGTVLPPHNPAKMFDEHRPFTLYNVILLAICGIVCAQCGRLTSQGSRVAWTFAALGFFFLALDDLIQIHERLDKAINRAFGLDPKAALPDLLDTGIVVLYGVAGVVALYLCRRRFFQLTGFAVGIAWAGAAAAVMVILDALGDLMHDAVGQAGLGILEDAFEALAVSCFFWTFVTARFQLRRSEEYLGSARLVSAAVAETSAVEDTQA